MWIPVSFKINVLLIHSLKISKTGFLNSQLRYENISCCHVIPTEAKQTKYFFGKGGGGGALK